jgi:large subunit ribosomal protein L24e
MKVELCHFSGAKILPSRGKKYVRVDGKSFNFLNGKCERSFMMRRNPRKTSWTVVYRRKNKKGSVEEVVKKRSRRTTKAYRPITGATLESILQKRNQKPEVRKAQREEAIRFLLSFNEVFQSELLILQSCKGKSNGKEKIQSPASTEVGSKSTDEAKSQIPEDC